LLIDRNIQFLSHSNLTGSNFLRDLDHIPFQNQLISRYILFMLV
jgi:hypothetical protein